MRDVCSAPAMLLIGNNPTEQHPLLAWQIRNNVRLHKARLYVINSEPIKLRRQAAGFMQIPLSGSQGVRQVSERLRGRSLAASADEARATSCVANRILSLFLDQKFAEQEFTRW